jgi:hypothetical protein
LPLCNVGFWHKSDIDFDAEHVLLGLKRT